MSWVGLLSLIVELPHQTHLIVLFLFLIWFCLLLVKHVKLDKIHTKSTIATGKGTTTNRKGCGDCNLSIFY